MATNSLFTFQTFWKTEFEVEFETPFSERLLSALYFNTDVGLIPRGKLAVSPASNFCGWFNWKKPIQGCYWCSLKDTSHQAICCSPDCLYLFHEWCIQKVNSTTKFPLCILPGCEEELERGSTFTACCGEHFRIYSAEYGMFLSPSGTNPHWYRDALEQQPIDTILDNPTSSKCDELGLSTETSTDGFSFDEDFETAATKVRTKIETYFSQLLETIRNRQTNLISELNEILSRYRQDRIRLRNKVKELEEKEEYFTDSTYTPINSNSVSRSDAELVADLKRETDNLENMRIEFEWTRKYAREASKIGNLKQTSVLDTFKSNIPLGSETASFHSRDEDEPDLTIKPKRRKLSSCDTDSISPLRGKTFEL